MAFVEFLSRFLHDYAVVCVALAIVPLKFLMVRLAKDRAAEAETLLAIPEDLCYVMLGLLLTTITSNDGPLQSYLEHSRYARTDEGLLIFANFALIFFVHKIASRWTKPQFQHWRAALEIRVNNAALNTEKGLALQADEDNLIYVFVHYFLGLLCSISVQLALAGCWLYWIGRMYKT